MLSKTHFNTRNEVLVYIRNGLAIVAELDPPADLREATFRKALDLLTAANIQMTDPGPQVRPVPALAIPRNLRSQ